MIKRNFIFAIIGLALFGLLGCNKENKVANSEIPKVVEINDNKDNYGQEKENMEQPDTGSEPEEDKDKEDAEPDNIESNDEAVKTEENNLPSSGGDIKEKTNNKNEEKKEKEPLKTEDGKIIIDLIFFAGQSNMSGCGGNYNYAPKVEEGHGYEFRAISDPTRLYNIIEPFGANENVVNAIMDFPGQKNGSMVSAFANKYYELTGVPIVAVSASSGGTNTDFWLSQPVTYDLSERLKRAQVWLESNDYYIRKQFVIWLQGESDAIVGTTSEKYNDNMDNIIRPLFIGGVQKVFFITPGRTITNNHYFDDVIKAQLKMGKESGYYGVATTILSKVSSEYMVDEWHYNQSVLNLIGEEAAKSVAYYTMNQREACIYDYFNKETYIPEGFNYTGDEDVEPIDVNNGEYIQSVPKLY